MIMELSSYCRHEGCKKLRTKFSVFCEEHHRQQLMLPERKFVRVKREMEFYYNAGRVGYFEEEQYPAADGRYRYMPYRSGSHYAMGQLARKKGRAECNYELDGIKTYFAVVGIPEYGVLELREFRRIA